jgi:plasmid stabilization system protein ParE
MAKKQVIWTKTSIAELENILQFYIDRNKSVKYSLWLFGEFEKRIEIISFYPKIGRKTDLSQFRIFPFKNFGIIYKETPETIFIESIWDFRQNPMNRMDQK